MADATQDFSTADDGFHEIHLSGKQLVFLFMATTVVSVIIFLCGVFVGRGVPARQSSGQTAADPVPVAAAPSPAPAPAAADAGPAAAEPPPAAETEELSYKQRLEGESKPAESLDPPAAAPLVPPPAARARASRGTPPAPVPAAAPQSAVAGAPKPGTWIVQVHALRDRNVATGIVQRLVGKGYPAYLVAAGPPTGTYKVQVGRFQDRGEALRVVERLKKDEQFNPWITR